MVMEEKMLFTATGYSIRIEFIKVSGKRTLMNSIFFSLKQLEYQVCFLNLGEKFLRVSDIIRNFLLWHFKYIRFTKNVLRSVLNHGTII